MRTILVLLMLLSGGMVNGQDTLMAIYGTILDISTQEPIRSAKVTAFDVDDSLHSITVDVDQDGRYMLGIFEEHSYLIRSDAPGYAPKQVLVDMKGPTAEQWKRGYGLSVDLTLFKEIPGVDVTMNGMPVGRAAYNADQDLFEWDADHSRSIKAEQKKLLKRYKDKVGKVR